MTPAVRAVCFDLDDTFWAVMPVLQRAEARMRAFLDSAHPEFSRQVSLEDMIAARRELAAAVPERAHDVTWLRTEALRRLAARHGHDPELAASAFEVFIEARHEVEFYPEVIDALPQLGRRFRLATFSNGNACVHRIGIGHHFEVTLNAEAVGCAKPQPEAFLAVTERLGITPSEMLYVGDHPDNDVRGAAAAGCRTAWVNRPRSPWLPQFGPPPDLEVPDLAVLVQRLG
jgi:putative hydrolase of the HAD superfamily